MYLIIYNRPDGTQHNANFTDLQLAKDTLSNLKFVCCTIEYASPALEVN